MLLSNNFNPQSDPNTSPQDPAEVARRQQEQAELLAKARASTPKTSKEVKQMARYEETYKEGMLTILDLVAPAYMEVDPIFAFGKQIFKNNFCGWLSALFNSRLVFADYQYECSLGYQYVFLSFGNQWGFGTNAT